MIMALLCGSAAAAPGKKMNTTLKKVSAVCSFGKQVFRTGTHNHSLPSLAHRLVFSTGWLVVENQLSVCVCSEVARVLQFLHGQSTPGIEMCAVFVCSFNEVFVVYNKHTTVRCSHLLLEFLTGL
jgi:threonine dehydratase